MSISRHEASNHRETASSQIHIQNTQKLLSTNTVHSSHRRSLRGSKASRDMQAQTHAGTLSSRIAVAVRSGNKKKSRMLVHAHASLHGRGHCLEVPSLYSRYMHGCCWWPRARCHWLPGSCIESTFWMGRAWGCRAGDCRPFQASSACRFTAGQL